MSGSVSKLIADLRHCDESGKFDDRAALLGMLMDMVRSLRLETADGHGSRGMRWHESTKRIFSLLNKYGGPRSHHLLKANTAGPHRRSSERFWRKHAEVQNPGINKHAFQKCVDILSPLLLQLGLGDGEVLPCEIAIDETGIISDINYDERLDTLIGCCGKTDDENHKCRPCVVVLGDDEETQGKISEWCTKGIRAPYAQLILLNPLSPRLPRLALALLPTCNTFTHLDVAETNKMLTGLFEEFLAPLGLVLTGFASDGDARRFKVQKSRMLRTELSSGSRFSLMHPGFTFHGLVDESNGHVSNIDMQDPKHDVKKLMGALCSHRILHVGKHLASHSHNALTFEHYGAEATGMDRACVVRDDRQNFLAPVRCSGLKNDAMLKDLEAGAGPNVRAIDTAGTRAYLGVMREFALVFFSKKKTLTERIEMASYGIHFMRYMRNYVDEAPGLTLKDNFVARQTFEHHSLALHSAILLILAFAQMCPSQPCPLELTGSDGCEKFFSAMAGCGKIQSHKRNINYQDGHRMIGDLNLTFEWGGDKDVPLV